ncbi:MAG: SNF2 helicase associated domain-containing protein [Ruminococcus sp.]|nr:SNF2 helicase associated domain-containing protein [Ruminococcus sp.]
MNINKNDLKQIFSKKTLEKANNILRVEDKYHNYEATARGYTTTLHARFLKNYFYIDTKIYIHQKDATSYGFDMYCECRDFRDNKKCEHLAALLLKYISDSNKAQAQQKTDLFVKTMMSIYKSDIANTSDNPDYGNVRFVPKMRFERHGMYPHISFLIGAERLYVIRNISNFCYNMENNELFQYGKQLTLRHNIDEFDEQSQKLVNLITSEYEQRKSLSFQSGYTSIGSMTDMVLFNSISFNKFFNIFTGTYVDSDYNGKLLLLDENPKLRLIFTNIENVIYITIDNFNNIKFYGGKNQLYILIDDKFYRCTKDYSRKIFPLIREGSNDIVIEKSDMPAFCSYVLNEIKPYITIVTKDEDMLQSYLPEECSPCFYFDIEGAILNARLSFKYNDKEYEQKNINLASKVNRNMKTELLAERTIEKYFNKDEDIYYIDDDERIYNFLTSDIKSFYDVGDVFVSDRLRNKQVKQAPVSVGISVSDGVLKLDFDTGEFPVEELEKLYDSLLTKRKYHKLSDGRFLTLDGSSYETLAEVAHMTQLSAKELKSGHAEMPAFRSLYLDNVLNEHDDIEVVRDSRFKSMIRSFKTVKDSDYEIPDTVNANLRPYQKTGYRWLKTLESNNFGGILADEMGLGKTLQIITFLSSVYPQQDKPALIVCPASLVLNWAEEFEKFAPHLEFETVIGNLKARREVLSGDCTKKIIITSYNLLKKDIELYAQINFYCCVLDEGQFIKNQSTLASKAVKRINCTQRFVLTGTPIENRLSELWNLYDFLMPGYLYNHNKFVEKLERPIVKSGDKTANEQLAKLVKPFMMRRLKGDVLKELPPKVEHNYKIQLSESERKVYMASLNALKNSIGGSKLEILAGLTRLRQICCDPALCFENYVGDTSKLDACIDLCVSMVENGHQILLFSQFTTMLDKIRERLNKEKISSFTIQGSTPKEKRTQYVKEFNNGGADVFLISLKAGGTGLNLTAADVVIHYDPWWNLAAQNQATDRAHRIGQKYSVQIYKLIAKDTIEEAIQELQEKKAALMDIVEGGSEQNIMNMSEEELLALLDI